MSGRRPAAIAGPFGKSVALLTTTRLVSMVAGFAVNLFAARLLGPAGMGTVGVSLTLATIAALVSNGGLNIAAIYFLGKRPGEQRRLVDEFLTLGLCGSLLAFAVVLLAKPVIDGLVMSIDLPLLIVTAVLAAAILLFELTGAILLGLSLRGAYVAVVAIEAISIVPAAALTLLAIARSPTGFIAANLVSYFAAVAMALAVVTRTIGKLNLGLRRAFAREALALGLRGQGANVIQYLNLRLDLLLVPVFLGLPAAGVYLIAIRLSEAVTQVASSSSTLLFPRVAQDQDQTDTRPTERTTRMTVLVVGASSVALGIAAGPLLTLAFGADFSTGTTALQLTMLAMIPLSVFRLMASDLKGRGKPGTVSFASLLALIATVALDFALIPRWGIEGAAMASVAAYTIGAMAILVAYRSSTHGSLVALIPRWADLVELLGGLTQIARVAFDRFGERARLRLPAGFSDRD